jgi:hypothetical protein
MTNACVRGALMTTVLGIGRHLEMFVAMMIDGARIGPWLTEIVTDVTKGDEC